MTRKKVFEYLLIAIGTLLMSAGINMFYSPNGLVTGGVTGIAIIVQTLTSNTSHPIPLWLTTMSMDIPLFLMGAKTFGFRNMYRTAFAIACLTLGLYFTSYLPPFGEGDLVLAAIFGGVVGGVGLGFVLRCFATTGGSDMAASLIHTLMLPHISIAKIMFVLDAIVIITGLLIFGPTKAMYAILSIFVYVKTVDAIQEGFSFAKAALIISEKPDAIAEIIMQEVRRGVTGISGSGMYTKRNKNILLCVVSSKEIVKIKKLVRQIDQNAFVIVADVREVMGEGFPETR